MAAIALSIVVTPATPGRDVAERGFSECHRVAGDRFERLDHGRQRPRRDVEAGDGRQLFVRMDRRRPDRQVARGMTLVAQPCGRQRLDVPGPELGRQLDRGGGDAAGKGRRGGEDADGGPAAGRRRSRRG
jgi:hypothetical protein